MACGFCLTGRMGLTRHLSAGEIAGQVRVLAHDTGLAGQAFNIVLMGMGEPLHNYDATMKALRMLADPQGLGVHPTRVTLSTVGCCPRWSGWPRNRSCRTSRSRCTPRPTSDRSRARAHQPSLRPGRADWTPAGVSGASAGRITFEYVLLAGVNDTPDDARRLVRLLAGIKAKVNLLPLNEAPGIPFTRPTDERVNAFASILAERGRARLGAQEPRPRHPRRVRSAARGEGTQPRRRGLVASRLRRPP